MSNYRGPMIVARGLYLGISPAGDKALWLATPREQYEFPKEMAPYLDFASGALLKEHVESLWATLEHGADAVRVLSDAKVIIELPADTEGALKALHGTQIHPLNVRVRVEDGVSGDGDVIHDVVIRRLSGEDKLVIPFPISTVMEEIELDLPDTIRMVAARTGDDEGTILGQVLAQLQFVLMEKIGFLTDTDDEPR